MAEDKKKEAEAKPEAAKKKGLPPIVMIALGAIVGGAGVVFAVPPKTVEVKVVEPPREDVDVEHPDKLEFKFNPRTQSGKAYATVSFYFVYTLENVKETEAEAKEHEAYEAIKANWARAKSNVLMLLKARTMTDLQAENGQRILTADMIRELDASLFPAKKGEKLAKVTEILWENWLTQ